MRGFRTRTLIVMTTLLDAKEFSHDELAGIYRARWYAELDLRSIKQTLKMDVLRCQTPEMVRKEIWGHLLVYNLVRGLMAESAHCHGLLPRQLSFQGARQMLEGFRVELNRATCGTVLGLVEVMLGVLSTLRVGNRPDRHEPRGAEAASEGLPVAARATPESSKAFGACSLSPGVSAIPL